MSAGQHAAGVVAGDRQPEHRYENPSQSLSHSMRHFPPSIKRLCASKNLRRSRPAATAVSSSGRAKTAPSAAAIRFPLPPPLCGTTTAAPFLYVPGSTFKRQRFDRFAQLRRRRGRRVGAGDRFRAAESRINLVRQDFFQKIQRRGPFMFGRQSIYNIKLGRICPRLRG